MNPAGQFMYCPIFDNGAGLLSDTTMDYPLDEDVYHLIDDVEAKTISRDFNEQLELCRVETLIFEQMRKYQYLFK